MSTARTLSAARRQVAARRPGASDRRDPVGTNQHRHRLLGDDAGDVLPGQLPTQSVVLVDQPTGREPQATGALAPGAAEPGQAHGDHGQHRSADVAPGQPGEQRGHDRHQGEPEQGVRSPMREGSGARGRNSAGSPGCEVHQPGLRRLPALGHQPGPHRRGSHHARPSPGTGRSARSGSPTPSRPITTSGRPRHARITAPTQRSTFTDHRLPRERFLSRTDCRRRRRSHRRRLRRRPAAPHPCRRACRHRPRTLRRRHLRCPTGRRSCQR